ncbi:uncharacterized protein LOC134146004 isoform X2 [Rhea pennata]
MARRSGMLLGMQVAPATVAIENTQPRNFQARSRVRHCHPERPRHAGEAGRGSRLARGKAGEGASLPDPPLPCLLPGPGQGKVLGGPQKRAVGGQCRVLPGSLEQPWEQGVETRLPSAYPPLKEAVVAADQNRPLQPGVATGPQPRSKLSAPQKAKQIVAGAARRPPTAQAAGRRWLRQQRLRHAASPQTWRWESCLRTPAAAMGLHGAESPSAERRNKSCKAVWDLLDFNILEIMRTFLLTCNITGPNRITTRIYPDAFPRHWV